MKLKQLVPKQVTDHFQRQADNQAIDQVISAFRDSVKLISKTSPSTFLKHNGKTEQDQPANGAERLYFWDKTKANPSGFNPDKIIQKMEETPEFEKLQKHLQQQIGNTIKLRPFCSQPESRALLIGIQATAESTASFDKALDRMKQNEEQNITIDIRL